MSIPMTSNCIVLPFMYQFVCLNFCESMKKTSNCDFYVPLFVNYIDMYILIFLCLYLNYLYCKFIYENKKSYIKFKETTVDYRFATIVKLSQCIFQ